MPPPGSDVANGLCPMSRPPRPDSTENDSPGTLVPAHTWLITGSGPKPQGSVAERPIALPPVRQGERRHARPADQPSVYPSLYVSRLSEADAFPLVGARREIPYAPSCDVRMRLRPCLRPACRQEYVDYFADAGSFAFVGLTLMA